MFQWLVDVFTFKQLEVPVEYIGKHYIVGAAFFVIFLFFAIVELAGGLSGAIRWKWSGPGFGVCLLLAFLTFWAGLFSLVLVPIGCSLGGVLLWISEQKKKKKKK